MMRVSNGVRGGGAAIRVLPLCGNRCGERLTTETSSAIAERLGMELAGQVTAPGALNMVPAYILGDLSDEQALTSWMEISRSAGYCQIFGGEHIPESARPLALPVRPWVLELDGVLTSVSRDGRPFGYGETRMYENAGYDAAAIEGAYLGDIGGVGLVKPGQSPLPLVEKRWTGLRRSELRACAARAAQAGSSAPGVVVLASGPVRANSLLESVRQGYVSHAVIDESLNAELAERLVLQARPAGGPRS
jgi:hypothetical protein